MKSMWQESSANRRQNETGDLSVTIQSTRERLTTIEITEQDYFFKQILISTHQFKTWTKLSHRANWMKVLLTEPIYITLTT